MFHKVQHCRVAREARLKIEPACKRLCAKKTNSTEGCQEASKFLMDHGYLVLLLNIVFSLLPVKLVHGRIKYHWLSYTNIYSTVFIGVISFLSYVYMESLTQGFYAKLATATVSDVAINLARMVHIFGFLSLTVRGRLIAKKIPGLWHDLSMAFQKAVINFHGTEFKEIGKFRRICVHSKLFYIAVLITNGFQIFTKEGHEIIEGFSLRFKVEFGSNYETWFFGIAYIIWNSATLSHVLVCMLLIYFMASLYACLKSINDQLSIMLRLMSYKYGAALEKENKPSLGTPINCISLGVDDPDFLTSEDIDVKFGYLRDCYCLVERVSMRLSKIFGFSLVIEILILMGSVVANTYFLIVGSFLPTKGDQGLEEYYRYTDPIIDIFAHANFFYWLSLTANRLHVQSRKPIRILKNFPYEAFPPDIQEKLDRLQVDISSTNINLTAADYFVVNKACLAAVFGSILTFVVVLIQFKSEETENRSIGN